MDKQILVSAGAMAAALSAAAYAATPAAPPIANYWVDVATVSGMGAGMTPGGRPNMAQMMNMMQGGSSVGHTLELRLASRDKAAAAWKAEEIRVLQPGFSGRRWLETHPLTDPSQKRKLVQALNVYARGRVAIAMRGVADQDQQLALAVIDDHAGVLAVQEGEALRFELTQPDSVIRRLVGLLPPLSPGPGTSVTVTAKAPPAARRRVDEDFSEFTFTSTVRAAGHSPAAQRAAAEDILRQPRLGGGDFLVTVRSRNSRQSTPITMNWLDTQAGRFAVLNSTDRDGRLQATYTPADLAALDRHLTDLVRNVS